MNCAESLCILGICWYSIVDETDQLIRISGKSIAAAERKIIGCLGRQSNREQYHHIQNMLLYLINSA